jgi:hypothetical protein
VREGDAEFEALREAIDAFAAEQAPHLVAEARAEAMARVRSILAGAMADSLLDHVGEHLAGSHEHAEAGRSPRRRSRSVAPSSQGAPGAPTGGVREVPQDRTAEASADPAYYVYGVARASEASLTADVPGVDPRHQAELIEHGDLAAIASRVSLAEFGEEQLHDNLNDVEWLEDKARAHEAVLDEALSRMTVVPMRLCTIYRTAGQIEDMLSSEHDLLADALRRLEGRTEWGVKLIAEPGAIERSSAASAESATSEEGTRSAGAAYLDRKRREAEIREAADGVAEGWAEAVHGRLATAASEALLNPLQNPEVSGHDGEMLLNGVYLVEDRETAAFRRVVDELAGEYRPRGVAVELTGPWPPYNFVKSSIEAAR